MAGRAYRSPGPDRAAAPGPRAAHHHGGRADQGDHHAGRPRCAPARRGRRPRRRPGDSPGRRRGLGRGPAGRGGQADRRRPADRRQPAPRGSRGGGLHSAGPPGRRGGSAGCRRLRRHGEPPDQPTRCRLPQGRLRGRAAPRPHALQHREPGLPGLGHGARGDPGAARRRRAQLRDRGRDPATAAGRPADLLGARPARHRAPAGLRRGGPVPDQPGTGRRGGGGRRPGGRQRRRGQQDRHLRPGPGRPPGGHPVPGRGARVDAGRGDTVRVRDPDRAARGRRGLRPGRSGRDQGAQLRVRHHPGRARLRDSH